MNRMNGVILLMLHMSAKMENPLKKKPRKKIVEKKSSKKVSSEIVKEKVKISRTVKKKVKSEIIMLPETISFPDKDLTSKVKSEIIMLPKTISFPDKDLKSKVKSEIIILPETISLPDKDLTSTNDCCRVCLKTGTVPIFGSGDKHIAITLNTLAAIKIDEQDNFPKYLCTTCHELLQSYISFKNTAQETDRFLRRPKIVNENNVDTKINVSYSTDKLLRQPKKVKVTLEDLEPDNDMYSKFEDHNDSIFDDIVTSDMKEGEKTYNCERCNIKFNNWKSYSQHVRSSDHKNYKMECPVCKGLYSMFYIKKHILRHRLNSEHSYVCDICGKSFVLLAPFKRHRAVHGFDLPFQCDLCPYRGRFSECLKMHMRTHTGEKPYACPDCPARFTNKSNLNKHSSTHKTEYDHTCDGCGKGFFRKRELELHIKVYHSGIREHVCNICGKAFGYRKQMMKHQLKVHKREKLRSGRLPLYMQAELQSKV